METEALFGSFTSAVGLALGELLLYAGGPEDLGGCMAAIERVALATLLAFDMATDRATVPRGRSLTTAALRVVAAWKEAPEDLDLVSDSIEVLEDVLRQMSEEPLSRSE